MFEPERLHNRAPNEATQARKHPEMNRIQTKTSVALLVVGMVAVCSPERLHTSRFWLCELPTMVIGAIIAIEYWRRSPRTKIVHHIKSICVFGPIEKWDFAIAVGAIGKAVHLRKVVRQETTVVDVFIGGQKVHCAPYELSLKWLIESQDERPEHYRFPKKTLPRMKQSTLPALPEPRNAPVRVHGNIVSTMGSDAMHINAATIIAIQRHPLRIWTARKGTITCIEPKRLQKELAAVLLRHPAFSDRPM